MALAVSVALHVVAIAAMAVNRVGEMDLSPPPVFGTFVSPAELAAIEGGAAKPAVETKGPPVEAAVKPVVEPPKPPAEPPKPPEPVKPPEPAREAIPIPVEKPPEKKPPKPPEKPAEKPPEKKPPEKPKEKPPPPKAPEAKAPEKLKEADTKAAKKPEPAAKPDSKTAEQPTARPTKADEAATDALLAKLAAKAAKAGVETGVDWGVPGGTGQVPTDACQAALAQYGAEVINKIRGSVNFPDQSRGLSARIKLEIAKDGTLLGQSIDTSSGNRLFDDSVMAGLRKAAPFPQLPACWSEPTLNKAIMFVAEEGATG